MTVTRSSARVADSVIARLRTQAAALAPCVKTRAARAFLNAVDQLRAPQGRDAAMYYDCYAADAETGGLRGRTPLAYLRVVERLAELGFDDFAGRRVLDFGYGSIGAPRLLAVCGAEVVGVDADLALDALYRELDDVGRFPPGADAGSVRLIHGRFPADPAIVESVGSGYDLVLSKNTLKRGYVHPRAQVDGSRRVELGVTDAEFLSIIRNCLVPGGLFAIYNLSPRSQEPSSAFVPHADGACPFAAADLERAGLEVVLYDVEDDVGMASMARALGWDRALGLDPERDIASTFTVTRRVGR